jgi:hypothetical protein
MHKAREKVRQWRVLKGKEREITRIRTRQGAQRKTWRIATAFRKRLRLVPTGVLIVSLQLKRPPSLSRPFKEAQ